MGKTVNKREKKYFLIPISMQTWGHSPSAARPTEFFVAAAEFLSPSRPPIFLFRMSAIISKVFAC